MEIKNTPASATGNKRKKSFLSVLKEKFGSIIAAVSTAMTMQMLTAASAFAESGGGDAGGGLDDSAGEEQFYAVIEFFAKWIGRIGLVVGFVGAIMFALAIKNDDAEAKTRGLMTLASGFVVFAVCQALNMFMT